MLEMVNKKIGMTTGRVQARFLCAWTRPVGLNPLLEPVPFKERGFFFFQPKTSLVPSCPAPNHNTNTNTNTDIKNTSFKSMNFPFKITNTNTNPNTDFINTKFLDFPFRNHNHKHKCHKHKNFRFALSKSQTQTLKP